MVALLVAAALAASFLPALWASRIDPVRALRQN
jgi:ABC-type lipoprotein release transport system permease subunit